MGGNSYGDLFRITTFGESHGKALGVVIDGCPAGLKIEFDQIQSQLDRRKPGQSSIVTQRKEKDKLEVLSGMFDDKTTGTPICIVIWNTNQKSKDYDHIKDIWRPSHADYTYQVKYGNRDYRGGGRSSARETVSRVIAGSIAKQILHQIGVQIYAWVSQVGHLKLDMPVDMVNPNIIDHTPIRCPDLVMAEKMISYIKQIRKEGNTVGGQISCVIKNPPRGLGEPVFDKLHAELGKAMMSINAVKGFEYGSGFASMTMKGNEHNDIFFQDDNEIKTLTNHSGGIQGGISNGMPIYFNVAFKPVATIMQDQVSIDKFGKTTTVKGKGRHDPCVVPRAVPIVESMAAIVLCDFYLKNRAVLL